VAGGTALICLIMALTMLNRLLLPIHSSSVTMKVLAVLALVREPLHQRHLAFVRACLKIIETECLGSIVLRLTLWSHRWLLLRLVHELTVKELVRIGR
jgi:hypothetical protein